ncbi:MAG: glycyl-radical enzyme activating protein, partial [Chloroflexi bacterium]|nr:glycyl-radical enzyme activating protein [Chloroflexota bacterium]
RRGTGVSNRLILDNLARLVQGRAEVWVRIPIIPGYNDDPAELAAIADLLHGLKGLWRIELLPFHHLGAGKYESLGLEYACAGLSIPSPDFMQDAAQSFADRGLPVHAKR